MASDKSIDITKLGPQRYNALQQANNAQFAPDVSSDVRDFITTKHQEIASRTLYDPYAQAEQDVASPLAGTNNSWGESFWDKPNATESEFQQLGDVRANNQPWYSKVANGLAKGVVLAGTTFLDGTIGLVIGTAQGIHEGRFSALWDNDFSRAMQSVNELSEEYIPNYYTQAEQEDPWYEHIFSANFLGDKFLKNLGFTVGAFYSGGVYAGIAKGAGKLAMAGAKNIFKASFGTLKNIAGATDIVANVGGAVTSAVNEGRIEALNNSKDWFKLNKAKLDDTYLQRIEAIKEAYGGDVSNPECAELLQNEMYSYNQSIGRLTEDRLKMGNMDLLMNIPILTASNIIQFGKMYSNGFKTAKKSHNIVGKPGEYASGTTKLGTAFNVTKGALSEGTEEITQGMASRISGNYYAADVSNFYKAKTDLNAAQEELSFLQAFASGINETLNDGSAWEEFFIGSLTGALGMPRFRGTKNSEGNWQSPITIEGGAFNEWREASAKRQREQEVVNYMNQRVQDPKFLNYYQGLIRHQSYQNAMNKAAEEGNEFDFKNAEHAQLLSDIVMFDSAGKLDDLVTMIKEGSSEYSDEELESIIKNTTRTISVEEQLQQRKHRAAELNNRQEGIQTEIKETKAEIKKQKAKLKKDPESVNAKKTLDIYKEHLENLKKEQSDNKLELSNLDRVKDIKERTVGPFVDDSGNSMTSTSEGKEAMKKKLNENRDEILKAINKYVKIKDYLNTNTVSRGTLNEDQLAELTWMRSQIDNWTERSENMAGEVKNSLSPLIEEMQSVLRYLETSEDPKAKDKVEAINKTIKNLESLRGLNSKALVRVLTDPSNTAYTSSLIELIDNLDDSTIDPEEKEVIKQKLQDIVKSGNAISTYQKKFKEYTSNPSKQIEDHNRADQEAVDNEIAKQKQSLRDKLNSASTLSEFRAILDEEENTSLKDVTLRDMEIDNNTMALSHRAVSQYDNDFIKALMDSDAEEQTKQDALKLWKSHYENASSLEQLVNPSSLHLNNENAFDDSSETVEESAVRFQNANFEVQKAMEKVNKDAKFKDRFSKPVPDPVTNPVETTDTEAKGEDRDTTGDSEVPTAGIVDTKDLPATGEEIAVGDITSQEVGEENKKANETTETSTRGGKNYKFYRPAIPELHIEASKEGDFRAFDIVVREREGADFTDIYEYLQQNGAFEYLNSGQLKEGDTVGFMIDPIFEEKVKGKEWHKSPTIFIIDKKNGQIIGSLDEGASANNFIGLAALKGKILKEFADANKNSKDSENNNARFVASSTTKVAQIMAGKVVYDDKEKDLKSIPNVVKDGKAPIFGIIKNGTLVVNGAINNSQYISPIDINGKEGRLYLMIPRGDGMYTPVAVRVKHFNSDEVDFDMANPIDVKDNPVLGYMQQAINRLANAHSQEDLAAAMKELSKYLYVQDVMTTWVNDKDGESIVISKKVRKPDGTYEKITINGKEYVKEDKKVVRISTKKEINTGGIVIEADAAEAMGASVDTEARLVSDIVNDIMEALMDFNLPFQISTGRINTPGYNNRLLNSSILTSNITDASIKGNWFITDYIDSEGNSHKAEGPNSIAPKPKPKGKIETPVGGKNSINSGTRIVTSSGTYYVDLKNNTITDIQGKLVIPDNANLLEDLAWAQDNFGDLKFSSVMYDGKIITPSGRVLDRKSQKYLTDNKSKKIKDIIAGRNKTGLEKAKKIDKIVSQINENQKRVDKTRTDGEFYYVLEDDGQYHPYDRVHSRLGNNWVLSEADAKEFEAVQVELSKLANDESRFNNYLRQLEAKYKIDLSEYNGKVDVKSRMTIVNKVKDAKLGTNSQRALDGGNAVDTVIRNFFTTDDVSKIERPSNMSEGAFKQLIDNLTEIKTAIEARGERFLTNNIVLFQKYDDGTRIAGEVDILSVDKDGNFRIYDVKTGRYSFYEFEDRNHRKVNYFEIKGANQNMSTKNYYTLQLSAYKNLFESQYGIPVTQLAIMPFVLSYGENDEVTSVTRERGIPITYNPSVNVPLVKPVAQPVKTPKNTTVKAEEVNMTGSIGGNAQGNRVLHGKPSSKDPRTTVRQDTGLGINDLMKEGSTFSRDGKKLYVSESLSTATHNASLFRGSGRGDVAVIEFPRALSKEEQASVLAFVKQKQTAEMTDIKEFINKLVDSINDSQSATPATSQIQAVLPILESSLELQNPINEILPENALDDKNATVGYYEKDGKLYKGYLVKIGEVEGTPIYMTKKRSKGFGNSSMKTATYYVILSNGRLVDLRCNRMDDAKAANDLLKAISGNPQKVKALVSEKTLLYDPNNIPPASNTSSNTNETAANINQHEAQSGAAKTLQKEQAVGSKNAKFKRKLKLRKATQESTEIWDQETEIKWLNRVLPQLSAEDRVKVVEGLIKVAENGAKAWGQFDGSIITLSDIAAKGTTYHEAFHVVFNLMLDEIEKNALLKEYNLKNPNMNDMQLEEQMAEDFREFVMNGGKDTRSLGRKILDFFKSLFIKTKYWKNFRPSSIYYFNAINKGNYVDRSIAPFEASKKETTWESLNTEATNNMLKKGWTKEKFNSISQEEKDHAVKCIAF